MMKLLVLALLTVGVFGEEVCDTFCGNTFAVHTSESDGAQVHACRQGCSLKRRIEFSGDNGMPSTHMDACVEACSVAFKEHAPLQKACNKGCAHDVPVKDTNVVKPTAEGIDVVMEGDAKKTNDVVDAFTGHPFFGIGPVILTPEQQASNDRVIREDVARPAEATKTAHSAGLLGEDGGASNPFAHEQQQQLLGADHGAMNPFAHEFQFPAQPQLPRMLGDDRGVFNPFASEFHPENQGGFSRIIISTNREPFNINADAFFKDFDKMMSEMSQSLDEDTRQGIDAQVDDVNQLLSTLMNFGGRHQQFGENAQNRLRPPVVVSDPSPILFNSEGQGLDLAAHEPLPPTGRRFFDEDELDFEAEHGEWLRCFKRRARKMAHVAHGMLVVAVLMLVVLAICMCHRRASARRLSQGTQHRVQYMQAENGLKPPPSYYATPSNHVKVDVDGASMKVASLPLVHTPPPAYEEAPKEGDVEKEPESVKIVA